MEKEIVFKNLALAKFHGAEVSSVYSVTKEQDGLHIYYPRDLSPDIYRCHSTFSLKYHCSQDWLMPIISKINALGYTIKITISDYPSCIISSRNEEDAYYKEDETMYQALSNFAIWYNSLEKN